MGFCFGGGLRGGFFERGLTWEVFEMPECVNAEFPNFLIFSGLVWPVKLLNERFKNLRPSRGGKSEGKEPTILLFDTSKYFNDFRLEMGFELPEMLQLERSRC